MSKLNRMIQTIADDTGENVLKVKRRVELAQVRHPAKVSEMLDVFARIENLETDEKAGR